MKIVNKSLLIALSLYVTCTSIFCMNKPYSFDPETDVTSFRDMAALQEHNLERADKARRTGNYFEAKSIYEGLVTQKDSPQVAQQAQRALKAMEKKRTAAAQYEADVAAKLENLMNQARTLEQQGQIAQAIELYKELSDAPSPHHRVSSFATMRLNDLQN